MGILNTQSDNFILPLQRSGNRKTRTDKRLGTTLTYAYDNIYQLQLAKQGTTTKETYPYDLVGNRTGVAGVSPHVKIMALKFLDASGGGYESEARTTWVGNKAVQPAQERVGWFLCLPPCVENGVRRKTEETISSG